MADLTITPANVLAGTGSTQETGTAGEAITQGKVVYKQASTGKYFLADNNAVTAEVRQPRGIALNSALANQPLTILKSGDITIGATMVAGVAYYLSDTPGGISPVADLLAGEFVALIGLSKSTTVLGVRIQYSGVSL